MCEGYGDIQAIETAEDRFQFLTRNRWIRLLTSPDALLTLLMGALIANLLTHSPLFSLALAGVAPALLYLLGGKPMGIIRHLLIPSYLTFVAVASQLFLTGQTPMLQFGPLTAYDEGLAQGLLLGSKILAGASIIILFSKAIRTLPSYERGQQASLGFSWWELLACRLRLPSTLVEIAVLTYRYLFLLSEEAERIKHAQQTRLGHKTSWMSVRSFSTLSGMLFVRSFDRAERVHEAMMLRGYTGNLIGTNGLAGPQISGLIVAAPLVILLLWAGSSI